VKKLFYVLDIRAQTNVGPIYLAHNNIQIIRDLEDAVNDKDGPFGKRPSEYALINAGEIDETTGQITQEHPPTMELNLSSLIKQQ
jgi:hypothetical protein